LYILNSDGSGIHGIYGTNGYEYLPGWSPDGAKIVFSEDKVRCDVNNECDNYVNLSRIDSDSPPGGLKGYTELTTGLSFDYAPTWHPDGTRIAYSGVRTLAPDGSGNASLGVSGANPNWSPDGSKIAYHKGVSGSGEIYVRTPTAPARCG
jgi:Tol biopolymer transport system component